MAAEALLPFVEDTVDADSVVWRLTVVRPALKAGVADADTFDVLLSKGDTLAMGFFGSSMGWFLIGWLVLPAKRSAQGVDEACDTCGACCCFTGGSSSLMVDVATVGWTVKTVLLLVVTSVDSLIRH